MQSDNASVYSDTVSEILNNLLAQGLATQEDSLRKSDRTRQAILSAAVEFVWDHAFHDLTVSELMKRSGQSRSAFYQYFPDLYAVMETLLEKLQENILEVARPWLEGEGPSLDTLKISLAGMVQACHDLGPVLRAVEDAAAADPRMAERYATFLGGFDDLVSQRIEQLQEAGWVKSFEARPIAIALNRMDASTVIHAFGRRPRGPVQPVVDAITRIWCATLYGESLSPSLKT